MKLNTKFVDKTEVAILTFEDSKKYTVQYRIKDMKDAEPLKLNFDSMTLGEAYLPLEYNGLILEVENK